MVTIGQLRRLVAESREQHEDERLRTIRPHNLIPLWYCFRFKPGHPRSEEFKTWFEEHNVAYTVFEQNAEGEEQDACVDFARYPDKAILFKLRFG